MRSGFGGAPVEFPALEALPAKDPGPQQTYTQFRRSICTQQVDNQIYGSVWIHTDNGRRQPLSMCIWMAAGPVLEIQ